MARIIFFGNERLATGVTTTAPTLHALIKAGYDVACVVSHHEAATSRKQRDLEVAMVAGEYGIPVLLPNKPQEIIDDLKAFHADIGVLVAYGKIVPETVIDIFPKGIINVHPSALPHHRGPTPLESVILSGETTTAVSVMKLVKAMDAGPVYAQTPVTLTGSETKQELADHLLSVGSQMILDALPRILSGEAEANPQKDADATFDQLIKKQDGVIDWNTSAEQLERQVRAYTVWPKSSTTIGGIDLVVTKARVLNESNACGMAKVLDKNLVIGCGEDSLVIEALIPAGKNEMTGQAFIAGYGSKLLSN